MCNSSTKLPLSPECLRATPLARVTVAHRGNGFCRDHMKEIPLTQGKIALVDDEDYGWVSKFRWYAMKTQSGAWYAKRHVGEDKNGNPFVELMHRFVLGNPSATEIDHEDCNGLNNQKGNLRICTRSQNIGNRRKFFNPKNTSQFKGVSWNSRDRRWVLQYFGSKNGLRYFRKEIDAARAYDEWAKEKFGRFARLNFPTEQYPNSALL